MDMQWICNGYAMDMQWICNEYVMDVYLDFHIVLATIEANY
jgi:hypothetical protein